MVNFNHYLMKRVFCDKTKAEQTRKALWLCILKGVAYSFYKKDKSRSIAELTKEL